MHALNGKRTLILSGRVMSRAQLQRLQDRVVGVAAPCTRKPRWFYDVSYAEPEKLSLAQLVLRFRQAFDAAAQTPEGRREVVDRITHLALEIIAIARSWLPSLPGTVGEAILNAQQADAEEEIAETTYLAEPTPANRDRWIDAIRRQRMTADVLEMHLMALHRTGERRPPLRMA